ncbi:MAG: hypothetical protein COA82_12710 [Alkaliphilus sp.]|jgi:hypothetical protein|nr:MAG: hypothetical protein COA82_12710 [Alkaliphilus sp.]
MVKKHKFKRYKTARNSGDILEWLIVVIMTLIISVTPLIVRLRMIELEGILSETWRSNVNVDIFSYNKMSFLLWCTILLILIYLGRTIISGNMFERMKMQKMHMFAGVYVFFIITSTLFAEHNQVALSGFPDRYEGMWVLLAYITIMLVASVTFISEKKTKILLIGLSLSSFVLGAIGLTQLLGRDLFQTDIGSKIIMSRAYSAIVENVDFTFAGTNRVYATLFNPNYVGSYVALVLPIFICFILLSKNILT